LTTDNTTPNGAPIRFMIDGADCLALMATPAFAAHQRIVVLFDGRDEAALGFARAQWKALKDSNAQLSYFQQNDDGRWDKKA
jgi:DNA polymerase-3 subunit chi